MAITRRQFVTRLGTIAAAMGLGQADISQLTQALAHGGNWAAAGVTKPKVLWVHGAECTGCSTSLLGLFENVDGEAIAGSGVTTAEALKLALGATTLTGHRTLEDSGFNVDTDARAVNIADVLIDVIDLQYHETVMGAGGDLAYQLLAAEMDKNIGGGDESALWTTDPFILVVEGAVQPTDLASPLWETSAGTEADWCSVGMSDDGAHEAEFGAVVQDLAERRDCLAVITIGQCAAFGGYPGAVSPTLGAKATPAYGVFEYLNSVRTSPAAAKVVNVPGCPTNPWWFTLTVVAYMIDFANIASLTTLDTLGPLQILKVQEYDDGVAPFNMPLPNAAAVDSDRRLTAVYGLPVHSAACPRYGEFVQGNYASEPGDSGCLQLIGCKGPSTNSLCGAHGWNARQPENATNGNLSTMDIEDDQGIRGGFCVSAGHSCMACTERGYPDSFVPFIIR